MAQFKINELEDVHSYVTTDERLWLNDAGVIVAEGDPSAASLFATPSDHISREDAIKHGLIKGTAAEKKAMSEAEDEAEAKLHPPAPEPPDATDGAAKLAKKEGIDLGSVEGSGAEGRITKEDVEKAAAAK